MKSEIKLNHPQIKAGEETSLYLLVQVKGPKAEKQGDRLPLNLSVVIDRSGSMQGQKLGYVKEAAQTLVRKLSSKDQLSLVIYDDQVAVLQPPMPVKHKDIFIRAISNIHTGGSTNLAGGWLSGCEQVGSDLLENGVNRTLLLTDGLANVGITNHHQLAAMAAQQRQQGVSTTTFGVGTGYNEDLLTRMAQDGGGSFYFIDDPELTDQLFQEELEDLSNVVGRNLTVAVETESGIRSLKQLFEYPRSENEGALIYNLGELYAEEERFQLFEIQLRELKAGKHVLGKITVAYDQLGAGDSQRVEAVQEIILQALPGKKYQTSDPDPEVMLQVLIQGARLARQQAVALADQRKFEEAQGVLQEMADRIAESGLKNKELQVIRSQLVEEAQDMGFGDQRYDNSSRKVLFQKAASSVRSSRYEDVVDSLSYRDKLARVSLQRSGPPPSRIQWNGGDLELTGHEIMIGSALENDIVLQGSLVEGHHCSLLNQDGVWFVHDLSRSGTIANGGRVRDLLRLCEGDTIRIGKNLLELK